ncbi:ferrous iron transport protein A [Serinibacter salmoneus]|uniref:Histone acetyltransferase Rv0428c-like SH3 domain-containing protein n=1 Tax=Serinibacter salmoneus TaxID=556530 RepID=A0A2A9D3H3_9MICO|nr:ferrous iron transport protein A [Serinibacter salmoneus]PFG20389.1 hypothetical protein ATL40_1987 [Serinibacter salmoneus]
MSQSHQPPTHPRLTIGDRVVVRYRRADVRPGEPPLSDAVGEIVAIDAENVRLETRTGIRAIPLAAVVAAKRVPPAPRG